MAMAARRWLLLHLDVLLLLAVCIRVSGSSLLTRGGCGLYLNASSALRAFGAPHCLQTDFSLGNGNVNSTALAGAELIGDGEVRVFSDTGFVTQWSALLPSSGGQICALDTEYVAHCFGACTVATPLLQLMGVAASDVCFRDPATEVVYYSWASGAAAEGVSCLLTRERDLVYCSYWPRGSSVTAFNAQLIQPIDAIAVDTNNDLDMPVSHAFAILTCALHDNRQKIHCIRGFGYNDANFDFSASATVAAMQVHVTDTIRLGVPTTSTFGYRLAALLSDGTLFYIDSSVPASISNPYAMFHSDLTGGQTPTLSQFKFASLLVDSAGCTCAARYAVTTSAYNSDAASLSYADTMGVACDTSCTASVYRTGSEGLAQAQLSLSAAASGFVIFGINNRSEIISSNAALAAPPTRRARLIRAAGKLLYGLDVDGHFFCFGVRSFLCDLDRILSVSQIEFSDVHCNPRHTACVGVVAAGISPTPQSALVV
jgi:hypothetical protein